MKKWISLLLAVFLLFSFAGAAAAEEQPISFAMEITPAAVGETAKLTITADITETKDNVGMDSLQFTLKFDQSCLKLLKSETVLGDMVTEPEMAYNASNLTDEGWLFVYYSLTGLTKDGKQLSGTLVTLSFEVLSEGGCDIIMQDIVGSFYNGSTEKQSAFTNMTASVNFESNTGESTAEKTDESDKTAVNKDGGSKDYLPYIIGAGLLVILALGVLFGFKDKKAEKNGKGKDKRRSK